MTATYAPDSPPDLSGSRSSKSSSYCSTSQFSNPDGILSDISNFEDIGLDDETQQKVASAISADKAHQTPAVLKQIAVTGPSNSFKVNVRSQRERRPPFPTLRGQVRDAITQHSKELESSTRPGGLARRGLTSTSVPVLPSTSNTSKLRTKSSSPVRRLNAHAPLASLSASALRPTPFSTRSSLLVPSPTNSWQPRRKSVQELEAEYHDSDEDVPDEAALWNVPMSPRPPYERNTPVSSTFGSPEKKQGAISPKPILLSHAQTMPESRLTRAAQS